jgi:prephenate dehydrogenase
MRFAILKEYDSLGREGLSSKLTISIVGGAGRMGLLLSRVLKDRVGAIRISSRDERRAIEAAKSLGVDWAPIEGAHMSDVVVVSVPIDQTVKVCRDVGQRMRPRSLLVDLASVKTRITSSVAEQTSSSVEYLSLHPLFGPQVRDLVFKRCIAVQVRGGPLTEEFLSILTGCGVVVRRSTVEEHDRAMAAVQVLHHHALLAFSETLGKIASEMQLSQYVTESLEKTLQNLESLEQNWGTISAIQRLNPYAQDVREAFAVAARELRSFDEKSRIKLQRALSLLRSP